MPCASRPIADSLPAKDLRRVTPHSRAETRLGIKIAREALEEGFRYLRANPRTFQNVRGRLAEKTRLIHGCVAPHTRSGAGSRANDDPGSRGEDRFATHIR